VDVHRQETAQRKSLTVANASLWWFAYPVLGVLSGFIAGLFGVGGGLILVPLFFMLFTAQGFTLEHVMHLSLGSSMTCIVFTSIASTRAHHAHGAVRWDIVKRFAPGLMIGTLGGAYFASGFPTHLLAVVFTVIVYIASAQMMLDLKPTAQRQIPGAIGLMGVGTVIGAVSSLIAAGGGFLSIPFMLFCNVAVHQAIGTSAALGFPIAIAGMTGYIVTGLAAQGLPEHALGFVYLPAVLGVVAVTSLMAPVGARLAHALPVKSLKKALGAFLALLASKMLYSLLSS
jgi:uncharacterized membrane protein YfcA